ncbi:hypothetical protein HZB60_02130 [candidate division KSB1 bacterium]|nr:hypothetical protein [candidate division KSB1 bacterium]
MNLKRNSVHTWCVVLLAAAAVRGQGLIIDHTCARLDLVPRETIESARSQFKLTYGHTSHGSQIVSGMGVLLASDTLYDWFNDYNHYRYGAGNPIAPADELSLWDYVPDGDLGNPDRVTWAERTRTMLSNSDGAFAIYPHLRNLVMWSWCGQVSSATVADIESYLSLMNQLEIDFPDVTFVYMTGHLDGSGVNGTLHQRNEQIRAYCRAQNKVLFDFADLESYDPDGEYYLDRYANDNCDYNGGNWAVEWCAAHPGDPLCATCSCAHSQSLNCNRKARAFWVMLARLAGWTPDGVNELVISRSLDSIQLDWTASPWAASYVVYSAPSADGPFAPDLSGIFAGTSWTALLPAESRCYQVVAVIE